MLLINILFCSLCRRHKIFRKHIFPSSDTFRNFVHDYWCANQGNKILTFVIKCGYTYIIITAFFTIILFLLVHSLKLLIQVRKNISNGTYVKNKSMLEIFNTKLTPT